MKPKSIVGIVAYLCLVSFVWADTMTSTHYKILEDSLNFGGGIGSSTSYRLNDTVGDTAPGAISSTNYDFNSGYLPMNESSLSISLMSAVQLPALENKAFLTSTQTVPVTVITDNPGGYTMNIKAGTSPVLKSGTDSISDYQETASGTPEMWSIPSGTAFFGFSPSGTDVPDIFKDNGSACGSGASNGLCFMGLKGVNPIDVGNIYTRTPVAGDTTTFHYKAEIKGATVAPGTYSGTVTVTVSIHVNGGSI